MHPLIEALFSLLIPQVIAALIGGLIGAAISIKVALYGWRLSLLCAAGSLILAGALAEYITYTHEVDFILLHGALGILVGILGNSALNSINSAAPDFVDRVIVVLSNGLIEVLKEIPKLVIKRLEELFNWFKVFMGKDK